MRVLFDITHPVHVHFYRYLIAGFLARGDAVCVTARDKDFALALLKHLGIAHVCLSRRRSSLPGMLLELGLRNARMFRVVRAFRPDVMVAAEGGVSIGLSGALCGIPRVVFDQVDRAPFQQLVGTTFATVVCTGTSYLKTHRGDHRRFRGCLAQAYLDPRRFRPDLARLRAAGVNPDEPYSVLRIVKWGATHDIGRAGCTPEQVREFAGRLRKYGRVFITSEQPLAAELEEYRLPLAPLYLHDLLAGAAVCAAEGGTVAVEAGILGTPAVLFHTYEFGYIRELEQRYGIIVRAPGVAAAMDWAERLLQDRAARRTWQEKRRRLFEDTDDVLARMREVIESVAGAERRAAGPGRTTP